jgi:hypothetical protein
MMHQTEREAQLSYLEDTALDPNLSDDEDWRPLVGWFAVKPHQATLSKNLSDFEERLTHRRDSPIAVVGGPEQNPNHMDRLARSRVEADELRSLVSERDDKIREA